VNRSTKLIVLGAIGLAACTGSLFKSKAAPPTIYMLSAAAPTAASGAAAAAETASAAAPAAEIPADLAILKPRVRIGLDADRIAVLYPDRRLDYFADARWTGPLGDVLQDLAVQEFHSRAHLRTVSAEASVFASAYWLEIEVTDFQAEYASAGGAPTVHVHFLARLGSSGERRILGQFEADTRQPAAENRLTSIVDAYARAADGALENIIAHADETLAGSSEK
jgi:cholesterol transport system auxiliary component